ncbi:MAG: T9SS type A sorting domain-containing protein [Muribaculaceae bacterium]|nr:T9SS type A sorting domain-containing protein [Muribaculaceae bacterium]
MKKILLIRALAVVAMLLLGVSAVRAAEARMIITTKSGVVAEFPIAETPVITYQNNLLEVKGGDREISVQADEVSSFDFVPSETSGVDEINVEGSKLSGLQPGTPVDVYTIEGQHVASFKADDNQTVKLEISDLAPGYYIVRTPNNSFKIKK